MQHFQAVDERVDFAHEALHEDDLAEANAHVTQFCGERLRKKVSSDSHSF